MVDHVTLVDFADYVWRCTLCPETGQELSDAEALAASIQHLRERHGVNEPEQLSSPLRMWP